MEGHVTLEFSNTANLPAKIYAERVLPKCFFESDEECSMLQGQEAENISNRIHYQNLTILLIQVFDALQAFINDFINIYASSGIR